MRRNEESDTGFGDDERRRWERLDAKIQSLIDEWAFREAIGDIDAVLSELSEEGSDGQLRARLLVRRGDCLLELDHAEEALEAARQALALGFDSADSYGLAGWASFRLDRSVQAREYFDEAIDDDAQDVSLLLGRALVLMELDEYEQARADLTRALRIDDNDPDLLGLRGETHMRIGDLDAASEDLQRAVELAPSEPEFAVALSRLRLAKGEIDGALKAADRAVDAGGEFGLESILLRSHLHLMEGDSRAARSDAIRASNLYPDEAFAFVQLAHVQLAEGNLGLAKKAAERAVLLDPSLSDGYMVRGAARQMEGEADEAREDFERASRAPAELPMFLLGPASSLVDTSMMGLDPSVLEALREQAADGAFDPASFAQAFGGAAGGMGGMDPMNILDQLFDDSGNIRGPLKPIFEMAFENAPKIMDNLPDDFLGDLDREELDDVDFADMSSEEIEERMREFYRMMKSGEGPFGPDGEDDDEDD